MTENQKRLVSISRDVSEAKLKENSLYRLDAGQVTVLVTASVFPFREYGKLNDSLATISRSPAKRGLIFANLGKNDLIRQSLEKLGFPAGGTSFALMPRLRIEIEVDGIRRIVPAERADIYQNFPDAGSLKTNESADPPPELPKRLPVSLPAEIALHYYKGSEESLAQAAAFQLALEALKSEFDRVLTTFSNAYDACFLAARESDPEHFGREQIRPGGMEKISESMLEVIAMEFENDPRFKGQDRATIKAKLREGKIVSVARSLSAVYRYTDAKGGRGALIRGLPIPQPPESRN